MTTNQPPRLGPIRFSVDPADVPAQKAARRMHLTPDFGQPLDPAPAQLEPTLQWSLL